MPPSPSGFMPWIPPRPFILAHATITRLPSTWPSNSSLVTTAELYKHFRLFSLKCAPHAFAATYEQEVQFPDERWRQRLQNKDAVQFVLSIKRDGGDVGIEELKEAHWLGMVVLVRKLEEGEGGREGTGWHLAERVTEEGEKQGGGGEGEGKRQGEGRRLSFHVNALFVEPTARGGGFAGRLLEACFTHVEKEMRVEGVEEVKVETLVDCWNEKAIGLYEKYGFRRTDTNKYTVDGEDREAIRMLQAVRGDTKELKT